MPLTDRTLLHDPSAPKANVEPIVLFSIIDHYSRRDAGCDFVVGTLIGTEEGGVVTISSCFPVPHTEVEDQIALNSNFHTTMLGLHSRIAAKRKVVGWYATGEKITENTTLFHEFYGQEVERPVHLLLDLGLGERRMSCKAFISAGLTLGDARVGTAFRDICCTVVRAARSSRNHGLWVFVVSPVTAAAAAAAAAYPHGRSAPPPLNSLPSDARPLSPPADPSRPAGERRCGSRWH